MVQPAELTQPGALRRAHLLALDADVEPSDVETLVGNIQPGRHAGASTPGLPAARSLRLSRHSTLVGPIGVDAGLGEELGLDEQAGWVFALLAPTDREPTPPPPGWPGRDSLAPFFPRGLPDRDEGRGLALLFALARRLHGGVRLADEHRTVGGAERSTVIYPDPLEHVDHRVFSHYWLAPDVLLKRLRTVAPQAAIPQMAPLLDFDASGAEIPPDEKIVLDGYAVEVELHADGFIEVGVILEEEVPAVVAAHSQGPQVCYQLRWFPPGDETGEAPDQQDPAYLASRAHAGAVIEHLTAVLLRSTGGIALDYDGFLVAESQLR